MISEACDTWQTWFGSVVSISIIHLLSVIVYPRRWSLKKAKHIETNISSRCVSQTEVTPRPNLLSSWSFTGNEDGIMALRGTTVETMSALIFASGGSVIRSSSWNSANGLGWWFGIRIGIPLRIPIPFIFGDPIAIQNQQKLTISWEIGSLKNQEVLAKKEQTCRPNTICWSSVMAGQPTPPNVYVPPPEIAVLMIRAYENPLVSLN